MNKNLDLFILFCGLSFTAIIVYLLIRKKISERNSIIWLFSSAIILILSIVPNILKVIARIVGVEYPPTLLFLLSTFVLLFMVLHHSIQISILNDRLKELTQYVAINTFIYKKYKEELGKIHPNFEDGDKNGKYTK